MVDPDLLNWTMNQFLCLVIILIRVAPLIFFLPIIGTPAVPSQVKILFSLMTALVLVPENQRPARHRGLMVLVSKGRADKAEAPLAAKAAIDYHLAPPPEAAPLPPAQGLPPDLFRRVCDALLVSGTFVSAENLRSLFADARISPWRHRLPAANDEDSRVRQTVAFLFEQFGADRGHGQTNALVQLLYVLGDHTDPADAQHRELKGLGDTLSTLLTPPLPETGASKYQDTDRGWTSTSKETRISTASRRTGPAVRDSDAASRNAPSAPVTTSRPSKTDSAAIETL